jgi:hypothetical protein
MAFSLGFSSQQHILLLLLPAYFDYLFSFSNLTPRCEGIPVCSTTTTTATIYTHRRRLRPDPPT